MEARFRISCSRFLEEAIGFSDVCGFVAVIGVRQLEEAVLSNMRDRLSHRGPDGAQSTILRSGDHFIGLGFRRLAIHDLSAAGMQPMFAADGQVCIVFNGEIYNFIEIREILLGRGYQFKTGTDTEVLLASYLEWGIQCLNRFNGQFAFFLWDARLDRGFLARDRFGEKPLYFTQLQTGGIAFASEVKALFAHPGAYISPNTDTLAAYTSGLADYGGESTAFAGVRRFLASHFMTVTNTGEITSYERYWTPTTQNAFIGRKTTDLVAEFRDKLRNSVSLRLRADVRVGACLSGGLDSSALVGLMALSGEPARDRLSRTISARFRDDPTLDEGEYIDQVLHHTGVHGTDAPIDPNLLAEESALVHWHQEAPFLSASAYLEWCVHRSARKAGLTVMIDGQGSDELLGGYQYYFPIRQNDWMNTGSWVSLIWNTFLHTWRLRREAHRYEEAERRFDPKGAKSLKYFIGISRENRRRTRTGLPLLEQPQEIRKPGIPSPVRGNYFRQFIANGLLYATMPNQLVISDRNAMAFGVEARFPFLDYELIDWCLQLPEDVLIRHGWQKWILRKAVEGFLPRKVQWRKDKVGFQAPQDRWLRAPLKDWAYDLLTTGPITEFEGYDSKWIQSHWLRHQNQEDLSWPLWRWISVSQWLRLYATGVWRKGWSAVAGQYDAATR